MTQRIAKFWKPSSSIINLEMKNLMFESKRISDEPEIQPELQEKINK
jgi:hypothetical protein